MEVNDDNFETATIFASIINPIVEERGLNSKNIVDLYKEFYESVNSYNELSFGNG